MTTLSAVVFDLDGTLIDSVPDIAAALNLCLMDEGRDVLTELEVTRLVGGGARELVARALGSSVEAADVDRVLKAFLQNYAAEPVRRSKLYPGAGALLTELAGRNLPLAICTNKPLGLTRIILDALDLASFFPVVWASEPGKPLKPDAACLRSVCADLNIRPAHTVMVGDSHADVAAACAAGCRSILVRHGYELRPLDSLGADALVEDLSQTGRMLANWAAAGISPLRSAV